MKKILINFQKKKINEIKKIVKNSKTGWFEAPSFKKDLIKVAFDKLDSRGPEDSKEIYYSDKLYLGFKRLAINGLNESSNQPIVINGVTLICNGEIYNYKVLYSQLYNDYNISSQTDSDCEIIIHLYILFGIRQTLRLLDGVFSFVLYDNRNVSDDPKVFVARDPFGVRPLFVFERDSMNDNIVNHINNKNITSENIIGLVSSPAFDLNVSTKPIETAPTGVLKFSCMP